MRKEATSSKYIKNSIHKIEITDLTNLGFGVGKLGGKVIFIADTVPNDVVEAKIIKVNSSYLVGRVEKYIQKSDIRTADRCSEELCKSCAYKNVSYKHELEMKKNDLYHIFNIEALKDVEIMDIAPSPNEKRYRNKAQYPISFENGEYKIGFFAPKSHRVTSISDCVLTPAIFSQIIEELKLHFNEYGISVYSEENGQGLLRHIYLRKGEISDEVLLTIVINGLEIPGAQRLVERISQKFENVVGILLNVNREFTNIILSDKYITLYGRDYIFDTLSGVKLKIAASSFYQVNHGTAELIYAKAKELARVPDGKLLLDLYCGTGSIGLSMADCFESVIGIEIVESAVECAKFNAKQNNIKNANFYLGDAKNTEKMLDLAEQELQCKLIPDVVVLDPPRAGSNERLLNYIAGLNPKKIVYISCNPKTLARDIAILKDTGYQANKVYPFDMFPMSGHVETIVCLCKQ